MTTTKITQTQYAAPTAGSVTDNATTGTFAASPTFWKVTATGPGGIEGVPSSELTMTPTLNHCVNVIFTPPAGATGYKVYRGPTGAEDHLVGQGSCVGGVSTTFVDTGAAGTVATMPSTQAASTVTKVLDTCGARPTKASLSPSPAVLQGMYLALYAAISEWLCDAASATSVSTTSSVALLAKKRAAAAGFVLAEV
jgi:hypothetical protein